MIRFADISIKNKLIAIIVLTSAFVSFIALTVFGYLDIQTFKKDLQQQAEINAQLIGNYCITPLTFHYSDDAKKILEELNTVPSIYNAFVFTEDNLVFAQYHRDKDYIIEKPALQKASSVYRDNYLHIFHPIIFQDIKYGTVYFRVSTSEIDAKIRNMLIILLILALGVTGISLIIANRLQRIISNPLLQLSHLTQRISEKDDYSIRVENTGNDEIGNLQKGFNNMLEQIEIRRIERNRAEFALRSSEEKYRQIVETAQEGIWIIDKDANTSFVNSRMSEMFGYDQKDMLGKKLFTFVFDDFKRDAENLLKDHKSGMAGTNEFRFTKKDGTDFWALMSANPLYDNNKDYNGALAMIVDITERKNNEKELEKYRNNLEKLVKQRTEKLKEAQKELIQNEKMATLGKLTASVSHELRNPLGTIRSSFYTVLARTKDKNLGIEKALERIDRNVSRCDNIIEDLLDYSRTKDLQFSETDFDLWIKDLLTEQNIPQGVKVETELNSHKKIFIDTERFRRCLINIIENASQAIVSQLENESKKHGVIKIQTQNIDKYLVIDIKDTGPGIPEKNIEKIFEPLYSTKSFGFGLGLSIVKQIMDLHSGVISVNSKIDEGTTFTLKLPLNSK